LNKLEEIERLKKKRQIEIENVGKAHQQAQQEVQRQL
jgi:hypothetical protein